MPLSTNGPEVARAFAPALATAETETARADAEENERNRWTDELVDLLEEAQVPAGELAKETVDPRRALKRGAAGKRAKTLRKKICAWKSLRKFLH